LFCVYEVAHNPLKIETVIVAVIDDVIRNQKLIYGGNISWKSPNFLFL